MPPKGKFKALIKRRSLVKDSLDRFSTFLDEIKTNQTKIRTLGVYDEFISVQNEIGGNFR